MLRIIPCYSGGIYDSSLVEMINRFKEAEYPDLGVRETIDELYNTWFKATWFKPCDYMLILLNDRVVGSTYMWLSNDMFRAMINIDPYLVDNVKYMVLEEIVNWMKDKVIREGYTSLARIRMGYEYRFLHNLLSKIFTPIYIDYTASLMILDHNRYRSFSEKTVYPPDIVLEKAGLEDVDKIVEIYNDAFSIYPWFIKWELEDARRFYSSRKLLTHILYVNGEPIGYCDAEIYRNIVGEEIGYIYTLAIKKKYRGKGYGSILLKKTIDTLLEKRVRNIYLDAVEGVEKYYLERGFRIVNRSLSYIVKI